MKSTRIIEDPSMQTSDDQLKSPEFANPIVGGGRKRFNRELMVRVLVGAALIGIVVVIFPLIGMFKAKAPSDTKAVPVLTVSAQPPSVRPIEREIEVNGSIMAWDPISIGSQAGGLEVKSVLVEEGDNVKKGQLLTTLDSSVLLPQLESERARLNAALASAAKAVQPNRQEDINALKAAVSQAEANVSDLEAAVAQAQANLSDATINVKRYLLLQKEGAVSAQELDTRQTSSKVDEAIVLSSRHRLSAARFALRQATEKLDMAVIGGRKEDIQIANANVAEIRGNVKRLEAQIEQNFIRAPVDGLITHRYIHIGDIATAGKTMFDMARNTRLELRAQVPESDVAAMKSGEKVVLKCAVLGDRTVAGTVREISPAVDAQTRLATVRIDIPMEGGIKTGMFAEGKINVGQHPALTVPEKAVITQDDKPVVFVVSVDSHVQARQIVTGSRSAGLIEVKSGLNPNDQVAIDGAGFLKDGDFVAVNK